MSFLACMTVTWPCPLSFLRFFWL